MSVRKSRPRGKGGPLLLILIIGTLAGTVLLIGSVRSESEESDGSHLQFSRGVVKYEAVVRRGTNTPEARREFETALMLLRNALELNPQLIECRRYIGEILVRLKNPYEGLEHLLAYLEARPHDYAALLWTARGYMMERNAEIAILFYERACSANREAVEPRKELARIYLERGRGIEAISKIQQAMALDPYDRELVAMMERALATNPNRRSDPKIPGAGRSGPSWAPPTGPKIPNPLESIERSRRRTP